MAETEGMGLDIDRDGFVALTTGTKVDVRLCMLALEEAGSEEATLVALAAAPAEGDCDETLAVSVGAVDVPLVALVAAATEEDCDETLAVSVGVVDVVDVLLLEVPLALLPLSAVFCPISALCVVV